MSTRISKAYDSGHLFHLFQDIGDEDDEATMYLKIRHCDSCGNEQTLAIPAAVWEAIRQVPSSKFEYAHLSDQEILDLAVAEVSERLQKIEAAGDDEKLRALNRLFASAVYGDDERPPGEQVADGIQWMTERRAIQQAVLSKAASYHIVGR